MIELYRVFLVFCGSGRPQGAFGGPWGGPRGSLGRPEGTQGGLGSPRGGLRGPRGGLEEAQGGPEGAMRSPSGLPGERLEPLRASEKSSIIRCFFIVFSRYGGLEGTPGTPLGAAMGCLGFSPVPLWCPEGSRGGQRGPKGGPWEPIWPSSLS